MAWLGQQSKRRRDAAYRFTLFLASLFLSCGIGYKTRLIATGNTKHGAPVTYLTPWCQWGHPNNDVLCPGVQRRGTQVRRRTPACCGQTSGGR